MRKAASGRFDTFISYSRVDRELAKDLELGLQHIKKPFWRLKPTITVLRDETYFAASEDLDQLIRDCLDRSDHLVLLLSPESATSSYVDDEIGHWRSTGRETKKITVAFTAGAEGKQAGERDLTAIDWNGNELPPNLRGVFVNPLYVDLRWALDPEVRTLKNETFLDNVAQVAADILETDKSRLIGETLLMRKKAIAIASTIGIVVASLALTALVILLALWRSQNDLDDKKAELRSVTTDLEAKQGELTEAETARMTADELAEEARKSAESATRLKEQADEAAKDAGLRAMTAEQLVTEAEMALTEAELALTTAERALTTAELAVIEADRLKAEADVLAAAAQRRLTVAQAELTTAQAELTTAQQAADAARIERDELQRQATAAQRDLEFATAEAARLQLQADAVRLALDSNTASTSGDSALALVLASESIATTEQPTAPALSAIIAARAAFSDRRSIPIGENLAVVGVNNESVVSVALSGGRIIAITSDLGSSRRVAATTISSGQPVNLPAIPQNALALSHDGRTFVSAAAFDSTEAFLRNVSDGNVVASVQLPQETSLSDAWLGPDGLIALDLVQDECFGSNCSSISIWDATSGAMTTLPSNADKARSAEFGGFTLDGHVLTYQEPVEATEDPSARWPIEVRWCDGHAPAECTTSAPFTISIPYDKTTMFSSPVTSLRASPDGTTIGITDAFGNAMFVDVASATSRGATLTDAGDRFTGSGFVPIVFDPSGQAAYVVTDDQIVVEVNVSTGDLSGVALESEFDEISATAYDIGSSQLVVAGGLAVARFGLGAGPEFGDPFEITARAPGIPNTVVAITPDGATAIVKGGSADVGVIDLADRSERFVGTSFGIGASQFLSNHKYVLARGGNRVDVIDLASLTSIQRPLAAGVSLALASRANVLAVATETTIRIEHPATGIEVRPQIVTERPVRVMAFNADGTVLAVLDDAGTLSIWNTVSGVRRAQVEAPVTLDRLLLTDDGSAAAWAATSGKEVTLWQVSNGGSLHALRSGRRVGDFNFNASGTLIVAAGGRTIWRTATAERVSGLPVSSNTDAALFIGQTDRILTSADTTLTVWDMFDTAEACSLAAPFLQGRDVAAYLPGGRAPSACPGN